MFGIFSRIRRLEAQNELNTKKLTETTEKIKYFDKHNDIKQIITNLQEQATKLGLNITSDILIFPDYYQVSLKIQTIRGVLKSREGIYNDDRFLSSAESFIDGYRKGHKQTGHQESITLCNSECLTPLEVEKLGNEMEGLRKEATPSSPKKKKK